VTPNEFWSRNEETRSKRFYVALCEFTSALVDYATGIDLLHRQPNAQITFPLNGTASDAGRLNWASTCFYYSLVHSGRMLVFLPLGDFPKAHAKLGQCFKNSGGPDESLPEDRIPEERRQGRERRSPVTDWLKEVAPDLRNDAALGVDRRRASEDRHLKVDVEFSELVRFYRDQTKWQGAKDTLEWFGACLGCAKKLRNKNNYEALLIAHEYDHEVMTDAFRGLASAMKELAHKCVEAFGGCFARYLETTTGEQWDCTTEGKIGFAQPFLEHRVLEASQAWYGPGTGKVIEHLIGSITELTKPEDRTTADRMRRHVDFEMFSPKNQLMRRFERG
jgi:hypothetical protein